MYSQILRSWGLGLYHMNFQEKQFSPLSLEVVERFLHGGYEQIVYVH